jgi:acyl-CoA synthetase (AMP-forming)/AMP-acid ligase II
MKAAEDRTVSDRIGSAGIDWLLDRFSTVPEHTAFLHHHRRVSYTEIVARVASFRARLEDTGVRAGKCVAILGDHSPELFCMLLALAQNRNVLIPLGRGADGRPCGDEELLAIPGCDWLIEFDSSGSSFDIRRWHIRRSNPVLETFLLSGSSGIVLFSSGSTGKPKAILHDFARVASKFLKQRKAVVAICFLMIDHFGGINTLLSITASLGTVVTIADRSAASVCRAIMDQRVQLLPATPSFLNMMLLSREYLDYDLSSLERITYGTEVMASTTLDRLRSAFPGVDLQQTYGLSELGVLRSRSRPDGSLWVQVGGGGFATKVKDGILWIKSDFAMVGYLNAPSMFDAEGWFNTGDQVEVDGEYFRFLGRASEMINVGGEKVYPAEIEDVILALDNVRDVAVFGETHPLLGQIVVAKIQLWQHEDPGELKKRVRRACLEKLANYKAPAKVVIVSGALYGARQKKERHAESGKAGDAGRAV